MPIPIVDLFAGPGGLGEGFASFKTLSGAFAFRIGLSVEKDEIAHRTLTLRAAFRALQGLPAEEHYYDYIRASISAEEFTSHPVVAQALAHAASEARCLELGKADEAKLDKEIRQVLDGASNWVLIGGPPCQAYSLAGRSRRANDVDFANDEKHFLYREYLRIIRVHKPAVFVMENVKGLISSQHSGSGMFVRIVEDLARPSRGLEYEIRSATVADNGLGLRPDDYVIEAEKFGVPQNRHRVILIGVRSDIASSELPLLQAQAPVSIGTAIGDLPKIRSRLSTKTDSARTWNEAVVAGVPLIGGWGTTGERGVRKIMERAAKASAEIESPGAPFTKYPQGLVRRTDEYSRWVLRPAVGGYCQHVSRRHMAKDLARYLFASSFAEMFGHSPRLHSFPPRLLPAHKNATLEEGFPFKDRFRVHCAHEPSWTVVSHIAKDGHYYIHYDPTQCRSLTVREAARVQTFPDDYFFEGNRTQQYTQVGNAVPPLLASKIARLVHSVLSARKADANVPGAGACMVASALL
jgi:DNA (cytosine-5)-methyltransferase 1